MISLLLALFLGDTLPAQKASVKICDPTTTSCVGTSSVSGATALKVDVVQSTGGGTSSTFGAAIPATGTAAGYSDGTNMQLGRVFDVDSGAGLQYALGCVLRKSGSGGSTEIDPTQIRALTSADVVSAAQSGTWNVTNISGTVSLPTGAATESTLSTMSGKLPAALDGSGFLKVHEQGTATISGTVTANAGTNLNTSALALDATLIGGTQKAIARGGAKGATTAADITGTAEGADHQSIDVQIYSGGVAKDPTAIRALTSADVVTTAPPSNASTNVAQFGGTNVSTGTGVGGAGIPRVTISSDSSLAANQSVNVAQIAAATVATAASGVQKVGIVGGAGTSLETTAGVLDHNVKNIANATVATAASGVQKVGVVGNAGAAFDGATAGAVPANAIYIGANDNGNTRGVIQCDKMAQASISSATTTSLIAVSGATTVYICSYAIEIQGIVTTAGTLQLEYGTGAACTTPVAMGPTWVGSTTAGNPFVVVQGGNLGYVLKTIASQGVCALSTSTTPQKVSLSYAQF